MKHINLIYYPKIFLFAAICFNFTGLQAQMFPEPDTEPGAMIEGYYTDGGDTIWLESADSLEGFEGAKLDMTFGINYNIGISFSSNVEPVTESLYGLHLAGMFKPKNMPAGTYGADQREWLIKLGPEVLRFPGGAETKLQHPWLTIDSTDAPDTKTQGYGYDMDEIIRYFDYSDTILNVSGDPLNDVLIDTLDNWILHDQVSEYLKFRAFYNEQITLPDSTNYLDQFIRLVEQIDSANPDSRVKVIVDLNIISEPASVSKAMIEYMRSNAIYNLNVYGVEMGNETYAGFYEHVMGFDAFEKYYEYINGEDVTGVNISNVLTPAMYNDHDFLQTFKGDIDFDVKVGLVGFDNPDNDPSTDHALGPIEIGEPAPLSCNWNAQLRSHYNDLIAIEGTVFSRKASDAVVIHPYYGTNNYKDSLLSYMDTSYLCSSPDTVNWHFDYSDPRLDSAFRYIKKQFKRFIKTEFKESWLAWNEDLGFDLPEEDGKELWTTEHNYKDADNSTTLPGDIRRLRTYSGTFMQGMINLEWYLKNIKMNYDPNYRNNFYTISAFHNWGGGGYAEMLSPANSREKIFYGLNVWPYNLPSSDPDYRNYYLRRIPYFVYELAHIITKLDLEYMKTNFTVDLKSSNVQPTVFIDANRENLYIFFTNVNPDFQNLILNTTGLLGFYPGADKIQVFPATIHYISAEQPYSTIGKSSLFEMNKCYNLTDNLHPMGIDSIHTTSNVSECSPAVSGNRCLSALPYSFGYFKVPFAPHYPEARLLEDANFLETKIKIYPNPTSEVVNITYEGHVDPLIIKIYGSNSKLCLQSTISANEVVDISNLPSGNYIIEISNQSNEILGTKPFVKI